MINQDRLLQRFLRYVRINTAADPQSQAYPSTESQRELGKMLADELTQMGLTDVVLDEHAVVTATVPSTIDGTAPTVALVAHMDTSPEAPSESVDPQVVQSYSGGDISLPSGNTITVAGCPDLEKMIGHTLVTTDGSTLLGGDDKAGVAIIMELAETLVENPHLPHGPVRVVMTCDEEIGRGTDKLDLQKLDATVAYTVDGGGQGIIDVETFSADAMTLIFRGHNIHPAIAKDRMVNSLRAASDFAASLPRDSETPETTDGRDGFVHLHDIVGGVGQTRVELILRSFDSEQLSVYADKVRKLAEEATAAWPGMQLECEVRRQYRNLADGLAKLPESVSLAEQAFENLGLPCQTAIVRGGTDGSQLTEKGLPTPNLSSGQHNIHSVLEFASLDEMVISANHLVELLKLWSDKRV
ncbi:peptidase T [Rhodopirellula europaea]|uniref:Peptidase T n=1 Tax=Rhodopirellula europaea 6C TaxID=1263867 RepID=M2A495_9BACT|nr:peptidase T [Rhodopirellula europaea]EMB14351.1 peptidase T [Rhodopirellula europaea 6C]